MIYETTKLHLFMTFESLKSNVKIVIGPNSSLRSFSIKTKMIKKKSRPYVTNTSSEQPESTENCISRVFTPQVERACKELWPWFARLGAFFYQKCLRSNIPNVFESISKLLLLLHHPRFIPLKWSQLL